MRLRIRIAIVIWQAGYMSDSTQLVEGELHRQTANNKLKSFTLGGCRF